MQSTPQAYLAPLLCCASPPGSAAAPINPPAVYSQVDAQPWQAAVNDSLIMITIYFKCVYT